MTNETAATPAVRLLPLTALVFSQTPAQQQRRGDFDKAELEELAASIKSFGRVLQPIVVRPAAAEGGSERFEIVAGERRVRASKMAGFDAVLGTVHQFTDEQVTEAQLIENLQREGLHELAEAEGYEELLQKGLSADVIAEKVGKSRGYVYARMKLLALCPEVRKAFRGKKISASVALLLARIPVDKLQKEALKHVTTGYRGPLSYREAAEYVQRNYMLKLSEAPFDTKAEDLVRGAVACGRCPRNTLAQPELFGDVKAGRAGVCTDPGCFAAKRKAWGVVLLKRAEQEGREIIAGADAKKIAPHGAESHLQGYARLDQRCYEDPKSRTVRQILGKGAKTALLQDPKTGDVIEVAAQSALRMALKEQGAGSGARSNPHAAQEKRAKAERLFRRQLFDQIRPKLAGTLDVAMLRLIAVGYSGRLWHEARKQLCSIYGWTGQKEEYRTDYDAPIESAIGKMNEAELVQFLQVCELLPDLQVSTWSDGKPERLLAAAGRLKIDAAKIRRDVDAAGKAAKGKKPAGGKASGTSAKKGRGKV